MLEEVEGCREGYSRLAAQLPLGLSRLLDLGCGTGLELEAVFARFPQAEVTAWDVSAEMLERACCKFAGRPPAGCSKGIICNRILERKSTTQPSPFRPCTTFRRTASGACMPGCFAP